MIATAFLFFSGCEKEEINADRHKGYTPPENYNEIKSAIDDFKKDVKLGKVKSDETKTVEQVLFEFETVLNYDFANVNELEMTETYDFEFTLNHAGENENGEKLVCINDVITEYMSISDIYNGKEGDKLMIADLEIKESTDQSTTYSGVLYNGKDVNDLEPFPYFTRAYNAIYPYTGGISAFQAIENVINRYFIGQMENVIWTNVGYTLDFYMDWYYNPETETGTTYGDLDWLWLGYPGTTPLSIEDMNHYLQGALNIINFRKISLDYWERKIKFVDMLGSCAPYDNECSHGIRIVSGVPVAEITNY